VIAHGTSDSGGRVNASSTSSGRSSGLTITLSVSTSGTGADHAVRASKSSSRSDDTNERSSAGSKVWSVQPARLSAAIPTRCQFSPSTTPTGVQASGTSQAVTWRFSGTRLEVNARVLAFPPRT